MKHRIAGAALAAVLFAGPALAAAGPALVYGTGGKFDKSFNEAGYNGAERFKRETDTAYRDFEPQNETQGEQALRNFASRGFDPVVALSFAWTDAVAKVANEFPKTRFVIVDAVVDAPNVRSVTFKDQEGSYLVGVLAGMKSTTKKVGFVGGMDIPSIHRFSCGYRQGARAAGASIAETYVGTTGAAWSDPVRGGELTRAQINDGADVVYAAAGASGLGVLQAAAEAGKLGVGVDSNQDGLYPGKVLTSMVKHVDVAVYDAWKDAAAGTLTGGTKALGLADGGVGFSVDQHNQPLLSEAMLAAAAKAKADIESGTVKVHDYTTDGRCP